MRISSKSQILCKTARVAAQPSTSTISFHVQDTHS